MILIINCGSSKTPKIEEIVNQLQKEVKTIDFLSFNPALDIPNANGLIISGAPILITEIDPQPYLQKFQFLKTTKTPVLGICFGHQILGMINGALASKCEEDRNRQSINILEKSFLFNHMNSPITMIEDHCEQISLPRDFIHLASSSICLNEAMQHKSKKLYGVQFHPEVSGKEGAQLIANFCELC